MQQPAEATAAGDRPPTCVLVLGMHRSGTSALTRVLNLLGVALGERLMQAAAGNNETGFWEHQGVVDAHDALLASFGMRWHDPRRLPEGWSETPAADVARASIRAIIDEEFAGQPLWGVKDPRLCRLLPLWRPLLDEVGVRPTIIHIVRQPLEISRSLERRDGMPRGQGLVLWLRHQIDAIRGSAGIEQSWVGYDELVADWRSVMKHADGQLHLGIEVDDATAATVDEFLVPSLRHHVLDGVALERDPALADWVGALYAEITRLKANATNDLMAVVDRVESELDRATVYFDAAYAQASRIEQDLIAEVFERDKWVQERDTRVAERDSRIVERDIAIQRLNHDLSQQHQRIIALEEELRKSNAASDVLRQEAVLTVERHQTEISELQTLLEDRRIELQTVLGSTSWRLTKPIRLIGQPLRRLLSSGAPIRLLPRPINNLRRTAVGWVQYGDDPHLLLDLPLNQGIPAGPVRLRYGLDIENKIWCEPQLYFGRVGKFEETHSVKLPATNGGSTEVTVEIPPGTTELRFDPPDGIGQFTLHSVSIEQLAGPAADFRSVLRWLTSIRRRQLPVRTALADMSVLWSSVARAAARSSRVGTIWSGPRYDYGNWAATYDTLSDSDRSVLRARIAGYTSPPIISVLLPVYDPPPEFLSEAIESVVRQIYPHWQLCIADDCSSNPEIGKLLERWSAADERIKVTRRSENGHISRASNSALELATGDYIALLDHDDTLPPHALYMVAEEIIAHPDVDIVFSDEDKLDEHGRRTDPYFKPEFNLDLFYSQNLISHLGVYRRKLVEAVGRFRVGFEGSQDYDLALRVIERSAIERIRHIPHILYHWRILKGSVALSGGEKSYAHSRAKVALMEHLVRRGVSATVEDAAIGYYRRVRYSVPTPAPRVSVIIPTKDRADLLRVSIGSLLEKTDYPDIEVLIVDNGSVQDETLEYLSSLTAQDKRVRVIRDDGPFNFSRLNNRAATQATGEVLCLLNNDTEVIHADWLHEMVGQALRTEVGAVGAKLLYSNGFVQHAGVVLGIGGIAGHVFIGYKPGDPGYFGREALVQCYSAVTAACLVTRRSVYLQVGGLDEANLGVAFNDVDYCLRVWESGHTVIWTPFAQLYHHESASRGSDEDPTRRARFRREIQYMQTRWKARLAADPYYNPNLSLAHDDFRLAVPPRIVKPWMKH